MTDMNLLILRLHRCNALVLITMIKWIKYIFHIKNFFFGSTTALHHAHAVQDVLFFRSDL